MPSTITFRVPVLLGVLSVLVGALALAPVAAAQPVGDQMCGDGTTFSVVLPATTAVDFGEAPFPDVVTLPKGCRIYAFLVTGYNGNRHLDRAEFYDVAEFVARNNGYVHWAWWNNLLAPYLERPLHYIGIGFAPTPGFDDDLSFLAKVPNPFVDFLKAVPDDDFQFQQDAKAVLAAVRAHNPDAIIVVVGHSMGGDAVARLGAETDIGLRIDLLAPIDPVGNRDAPIGRFNLFDPASSPRDANWTRFRATHDFRGYRQVDCIRDSSFFNLCADFNSNLFITEFRCQAVGGFLPFAPVFPFSSLAPTVCVGPDVDEGIQRTFKTNVRFLYHRWQTEALPPLDFRAAEYFGFWTGRTASIFGGNYQEPFETCRQGAHAPDIACSPTDGHSEIIGYWNDAEDNARLIDWPADAHARRQSLIQLAAGEPEPWPHRPPEPGRCALCKDLTDIIQFIMDQQPGPADTTPPATVATADPAPNEHGWNNEDVSVTLQAGDIGGAGVEAIVTSLTGAQSSEMAITSGAIAQETVSAEGLTTLSFFAVDTAGNQEAARALAIQIDKTPPQITAVTSVQPNADGWNRTDLLVRFPASDTGSGLAASSGDRLVSSEGANQEIIGTASDRADNHASASVVVSLDKTPPHIELSAPLDGARYLLAQPVAAHYGCADALSGAARCAGPVVPGAPIDTATVGRKTFVVEASDVADNPAAASHGYSVTYAFDGFQAPIANAPAFNAAKAGGTIPVKWQLKDFHQAFVSDLASFGTLSSAAIACDGAPTTTSLEATTAPGGTGLRYDSDTNQFIYNWKTSSSWTGCRVLQLTLADGTRHDARFIFK